MRVTRAQIVDTILVATCIAVLGMLFIVYRDRQAAVLPDPAATVPHQFNVGELVGPLPGLDDKIRTPALVLFAKSTCKFCTESMPFYVRLAAAAKASNVRFIVAGWETEEVLSAYVTSHGLTPTGFSLVPDDYKRVSGTPTLVLTDSQSRILRVWVGALTSSRGAEAGVLAEVRRVTGVADVSTRRAEQQD